MQDVMMIHSAGFSSIRNEMNWLVMSAVKMIWSLLLKFLLIMREEDMHQGFLDLHRIKEQSS